jgi:glutathione reductase (NADPH)
MTRFDFDLFVVGGGSGGVRAARIAAGYGARVAIAEEDRYGGTCVIRGCIPKKLMVYASAVADEVADASAFGWRIGYARFSWPEFRANLDAEIARLEGVYRRLLADKGVTVVDGRAHLEDAHTIAVQGRRFTAETVLIATGAKPMRPAIPGAEHFITSDDVFRLGELPHHVVIFGSGYIACEFAGIFHGLGSKVTLVFRRPQVLRGFDNDVRCHLGQELQNRGIELRPGLTVSALARASDKVRVALSDGSVVDADAVLAATGRLPNTRDLGLDALGASLGPDGAVEVDEWSRSNIANVYAVGDVTNRLKLTPVALHEGHAFADTLYGNRPRKPDHRFVPHTVFSQPSVGAVGWTEEEARAQRATIDVYRSEFTPLKHTLTGRGETSLVKLVVDSTDDRVLGCHMVGADAGEIIQGLAIAVRNGIPKSGFDATLGIHPTLAEEFVTLREPVARPQAAV